MDKLSNLSVQLSQIEQKHASDQIGISDSRLAVVNAVETFRRSRFRLGEALSKYKAFFIEQRGWLAAAKLIADFLGCDERTVRRIVSDFESVSGVPEVVIKALEQIGIDPAARKNATIIQKIIRMPNGNLDNQESAIRSAVSEVKSTDLSRRKRESGSILNRRLSVRKKIRSALAQVPKEQKLTELIAAVEEEMFSEWGMNSPVTLTITPREAQTSAQIAVERRVA